MQPSRNQIYSASYSLLASSMYAVCVHVFKWNENQNDSIFSAYVILTIADTVTKNNDNDNNNRPSLKGYELVSGIKSVVKIFMMAFCSAIG